LNPASVSRTCLALYLRWLGARFGRSFKLTAAADAEAGLDARISVGRRYPLRLAVRSLTEVQKTVEWEQRRSSLEAALAPTLSQPAAIWAPYGAELPSEPQDINNLAEAARLAIASGEEAGEIHIPVTIYLRKTADDGSVLTALGGFAQHWAQFTGRVPGSFQLNSEEVHRLPQDEAWRAAAAETIIAETEGREIGNWRAIPCVDAWSYNLLDEGATTIIGAPYQPDEAGAALRKNLRRLLKDAADYAAAREEGETTALLVIAPSVYASEEKVTWAMRGFDPALYRLFDFVSLMTDAQTKPVFEPARGTLPWDQNAG
jgi:hypothetical protein